MRGWFTVWLAAGCAHEETPTDTGTPPEPTLSLGPVKNLRWEPLPDGLNDFVPTDGSDPVDFASSLVVAKWEMTAPGTVHFEVSVDPDVWQPSPSRAVGVGEQSQVLVGVPYASTAQWRVVIEDTDESLDGLPITTAELPTGLPAPVLTVDTPEAQLPNGNYLLTSMNAIDGGWTGGTYYTLILDRKGRVLWARRTPGRAWTLFAQVAVTGDRILWDEQTYWSAFTLEGLASQVHSTYLDEEIEVIPTPGLHHEFIQLPDGSLVWGSECHGGGESLVELHPEEFGTPTTGDCPNPGVGHVLWTCLANWPGVMDCQSNGLFYHAATDTFLYSFYSNSSIVELAHATGETLWWAGDKEDGYTFEPANAQFSWQHGISYTDAGTLLVSSEWGGPAVTQTWLLEYTVDTESHALDLVWSDNSDVRAMTNGQAWRLANGNTLHIVGSAAVVREVTTEGVDVWRLEYGNDYLMGHGQFVEDLYALVKPPPEAAE